MDIPKLVDMAFIIQFYKRLKNETHKGLQGHSLIIAGSYGKIGACVLATRAALKSGCGLVTAYLPKCGYTVLQSANPEVMCLTDVNENFISSIDVNILASAVGIGPGLGIENCTQEALIHFLTTNKNRLVIDADALNILALNKEWLTLLPKQTILTPHKKELERLIGFWTNEEEKITMIEKFSTLHDLIIVVKGAPTCIIYKNHKYINATGNAALATAGSGDVLTGIITGLLAQNYSPIESAILGVFIHGLSADLAVPEVSQASFIASDGIRFLGKAFLEIEKHLSE